MGYDITFHPITRWELTYYVLEVFASAELSAERRRFVAHKQQEEQYLAEGVYGKFPAFREKMQQGNSGASTISFAAAAIAGYLHPYWYSRGAGLTLLGGFSKFFTPLHEVLPEAFVGMRSSSCIEGNYTASGYVYPEQIQALLKAFQENREAQKAFGEANRESLLTALDYCERHNAGLIEAADIFVPLSGQSYTDPRNFRSWSTGNLKDYRTARWVRVKMDTASEVKKVLQEHRAEIERGQIDLMVEAEMAAELNREELELLVRRCPSSMPLFASRAMPLDLTLEIVRGGKSTGIANLEAATYAAANTLLPPALLAEMAGMKHCTLQVNLASNPSTPPETLEFLREFSHTDRFPALRRHIAGNPNASAETIAIIAKDKHKPTRDLARSHPKYNK